MPPSASSNLLLASCLLNVALAAAKLVAAALTGSGAVLAEFIHSVAAATSQFLALIAIRQAMAGPDRPYALADLRFWSLVAPILIYSLGAGVALNEGTAWLQAPRVLSELPTGLIILAVILALQAVLAVAIWRHADPADPVDRPLLLTLRIESIAAVAGPGAALAGLAAAYVFGTVESDALSAVVVGLIMGGVAAMTALETRSLLRGADAAEPVLMHAAATGPADAEAAAPEPAPAREPEAKARAAPLPPKNHPPPRHGKRKRR